MVREGAADGLDSIIAFHVDPTIPAGRVGLRSGAVTASADRFYITLEGPGGHTARPHRTVDLIYAAGKVITDLPALIDRLTDSRAPLALVFGKVAGGTADNVIPTTVELSGTCRTLDRGVWEEMPALLERLVQEIAAPTGAKVTFHFQRGHPPGHQRRRRGRDLPGSHRPQPRPGSSRPSPRPAWGPKILPDSPKPSRAPCCGSVLDPRAAMSTSTRPLFRLMRRSLETGLLAGVSSVLALLSPRPA